jgi:hypothetical protein
MPLMLEWRLGGLSAVVSQRDAFGMTGHVMQCGDRVLLRDLILNLHNHPATGQRPLSRGLLSLHSVIPITK